jgi:ribosome-binding factor A
MSNRPERVGDQIRVELTDLLAREVHDPGIGFVTITRVKVSPDLMLARVYYTSLGDERARRESEKALKRATPFLRRQIGQRIRLRRVPEIEFFYDESIAHQDRIERILHELEVERVERSEGGAGATEPRERSGAPGVPASERVGGSGGAKPPGLNDDETDDGAGKN